MSDRDDAADGPRATPEGHGDKTTIAMFAGVAAVVAAAAGSLAPWFTSAGGDLVSTSAWGFVSQGAATGGSGAWWDGHAPTGGDAEPATLVRRGLVALGIGAASIAAAAVTAPESRIGSKTPERLMHGGGWILAVAAMVSAIGQWKVIENLGGSPVPAAGLVLVVAAFLVAFVGSELLARTRTSSATTQEDGPPASEDDADEVLDEEPMSNETALAHEPQTTSPPGTVPPQLPSGLSVSALVLGLVALPMAVFAIGIIPAVLAIIFGGVALSRTRRGIAGRPTMATSGIVIGSIALVTSLIVAGMIIAAIAADSAEQTSGTNLLHERESAHDLIAGSYVYFPVDATESVQLVADMESNVALDFFVFSEVDFENYRAGVSVEYFYCPVGPISAMAAHTCDLEAGHWVVVFDHTGWGRAKPAQDEVARMSYRVEVRG